MPLYKRTPFPLAETPQNLEPRELVYQIRFTKEIFTDYKYPDIILRLILSEYLNRLNLYRQRLWTCKITGKTNLTFEEALVSEKLATEKLLQFPKDLIDPVLRIVQFSSLKLKDLVSSICKTLQDRLVEGDEVYGRKEQSVCPCKILRVLEGSDSVVYEVGWTDKNKNVTDSSVVKADELIQKKLPFSRNVLKSFIKESTYRSFPWIIHEHLAEQYGISTELPQELQEKLSTQNKIHSNRGKQGDDHANKRKKPETESSKNYAGKKKVKKEEDQPLAEPIKYPIDDLLVQPNSDDPKFTDRPTSSREFSVPMDCVGGLLMVWDFCSSFGRLLQLSPFSLEDFQKAICYKDSNLVLIVESHSAILRLLIKEEGDYFTMIQNRNRNGKITVITWTNYLCDFIEMRDVPELSSHVGTIRRGHYGLLDIHAKLGILQELVAEALVSNSFREQLDEYIEQRQALAATKRGEALEKSRKKREEKELQEAASETKVTEGHVLENGGGGLHFPENGYGNYQNGHVQKEEDGDALHSARKNTPGSRKRKSVDMEMKKSAMKQKSGAKESSCTGEDNEGIDETHAKHNNEQKDNLEREIEKRLIRTNPLGKDGNYNRYWFFPRDGRMFVESPDSKLWGYYSSNEELDALMGSLNPKGVREKALQTQLKKNYNRICLGFQKRSKFIAHKIAMEDAAVRRSTRVQAPKRNNPALAFREYVNKWKPK